MHGELIYESISKLIAFVCIVYVYFIDEDDLLFNDTPSKPDPIVDESTSTDSGHFNPGKAKESVNTGLNRDCITVYMQCHI